MIWTNTNTWPLVIGIAAIVGVRDDRSFATVWIWNNPGGVSVLAGGATLGFA